MIPALVVAVLARSSVLSVWLPTRVLPDVALILIVLYGGLRGWRHGLALGLLGGSIEGLVSAAPAGVPVFRLGMVGLGAGMCQSRFERTGVLFPPALVAVATLVADLLLAALALQAAGRVVVLGGPLAADIAVQSVVNAGLSAIALPIIRRLFAPRPATGEPLS